ncbi:ATP-binding protein [Fervidobacterium sp.]
MIIKEFHIRKYGPLSYKEPIKPQKFTIFYGENESGKTLTIEAILKLFLGKKEYKKKNTESMYQNINRISDFPIGYVSIKSVNGEFTIENGEFIEKSNISLEELKNILVVRNSDLSIQEDSRKEPEIYSKISEKLIGSKITEIENLRKEILERAIITEKGSLKDQKQAPYKTKYDTANTLLKEIQSLLPDLEKQDYFSLEEEISKTKEQIEQLEQTLLNVKLAKQKMIFTEITEHTIGLEGLVDEISNYEKYTIDKLNQLSTLYSQIKEKSDNREKVKEAIEKTEEILNSLQKQLEENSKTITKTREKSMIAKTLNNDIANYEQQNLEKPRLVKAKNLSLTLALLVILVGPLISIFMPNILYKSISISIALALGIIFLLRTFDYIRKLRTLDNIYSTILKHATTNLNSSFSNLENLKEEISKIINEYESALEKEKELNSKKLSTEERKKELDGTKNELNSEIDKIKNQINSLLKELSINSIEEMQEKLKKKSELENQYQSLISQIEAKIRVSGIREILSKNLRLTKNELTSLKNRIQELSNQINIHEDLAQLTELTKHNEDEIDKEIKIVREKLEKLQKQQSETQTRLRDIFKEAWSNSLYPEFTNQNTDVFFVSDILTLKETLERFVENMNKQMEDEITALEILREIEDEERKNISTLFQDSNLMKIFTELTDGRYINISYERNEGIGRITLTDKSGNIFTPEQISAGTYDQLYFSIRLALAEHLFGKNSGEKAFFILDDPFVRYDKNRLEKQIKKLVDLSNQGWQFLYFTAKDEVVEIGEKTGIDIIKLDEVTNDKKETK